MNQVLELGRKEEIPSISSLEFPQAKYLFVIIKNKYEVIISTMTKHKLIYIYLYCFHPSFDEVFMLYVIIYILLLLHPANL